MECLAKGIIGLRQKEKLGDNFIYLFIIWFYRIYSKYPIFPYKIFSYKKDIKIVKFFKSIFKNPIELLK